jgi:hypothetical protein
VPGVVVKIFVDLKDAAEDIADADAAYGTVPPELLARATKLRWICAARARWSLVPLRKKFTSRGDPETEGRRGAS